MSGPPRPPLQNPLKGTTIDTAPKTLGLHGVPATAESGNSSVVDKRNKHQAHDGIRTLAIVQLRVNAPTEDAGTTIERSASPIHEVDPFTAPDSPPPSRPTMSFRGEGSLRMGTQTLIQALQAIPWAEGEDGTTDLKDDSDDDDEKPTFALSSSIHTIHRPVARARKHTTALPQGSSSDDSSIEEEDDFDLQLAPPVYKQLGRIESSKTLLSSAASPRVMMSRSASLSTVKFQRRAKLAEKLKEVFEVEGIEEVVAEMPCWLLRSVLLQGYMYLTNSHICFFAHLPSREDQILKSGNLSKKAQRTKRWTKHWFVLKNDALTWFHSSADPYFPHGVIDLRYAVTCEPKGEKGISLRTNQKTVTLEADSIPSRDEWVKSIRKVVFQAQNLGDSVKIALPYSAVLDVERSKAMEFSETIEIKVVDKEENCVDSYFFAYFHDIGVAVEEIRSAVAAYRDATGSSPEILKDTTSHRISSGQALAAFVKEQEPVAESSGVTSTSTLSTMKGRLSTPVSKLGSLLRPSTVSSTDSRPTSLHTVKSAPVTVSSETAASTVSPQVLEHTYPPPTLPHHNYSQLSEASSAKSAWSVPVPSWLKNPSRHFFATSSELNSPDGERAAEISDIYSPGNANLAEQADFGFAMLDGVDSAPPDPSTVEKFRAAFALDEKEVLIAELPGYLFRVLPVFGRVNISTNYFCFRSSQVLTRTRMMIPIRDILATEKQKAFRFGHHGLVVVIKGHEELFFEFNSIERRNACAQMIEKLVEELRQKEMEDIPSPITRDKHDALILGKLESLNLSEGEENPIPPPETLAESLPAVMFTSTGSTFLTFKPQESLRFTCLTIGSRGDVQPYIALAKALQADGHTVKIATHIEFKDWIEGHGIEYAYVGGDPAELMRICVENGTFTVAFLREGLSKFRGWLDDLLKTSWKACQNTDVLIESPSAMGGIHIAEALQIPYYRAFTMPWTRTRAYPHAFVVPDTKMGGGYNYLTYVMFDSVFWRAISGQINRWRRHTLGIPPTTLDKQEAHKAPFLYNFSPTIVPPPLDWYEWIRITGYWFLDDSENSTAKKWEPPAGLVEFIDKAHSEGKKVVYIGFGSIVVSDPDAMTRCVIESVVESGVYAIMSKGWSDRLSTKKNDVNTGEIEEPLPPTIFNITAVPHDWLFKRIDAACHHGGAGTTGASLRAGIPTIIKPFFGDQFFWADRVEALGIGSGVRKLTVDNLVAALISATTDTKQIARAKAVGRSIQAENGVAKAVEAIYRDLEYARSIIKPLPEHDAEDGSFSEVTWPANGGEEPGNGAFSEDWSVISAEEDSKEKEKEPSGSRSPFRRAAALKESLGFGGSHSKAATHSP